jgi:hypothetical protein
MDYLNAILAVALGLAITGCPRRSHTVDAATSAQTAVENTADSALPESITAAQSAGSFAVPPGECEATLHTPADRSDIRDLTLTAQHLVWRENTRVMVWTRSTGPSGPKRAVYSHPRLRAVTADDQYLYIGSDDGISRLALDGSGTPERMLAPSRSIIATLDDLLSNGTDVIVSRDFGQLVRVSKQPPFASQVFSLPRQKRNVFARWTVSDHAVWFSKPGRGLGSGGWVRLDLTTGATVELSDTSAVHANGPNVVLVRSLRATPPAAHATGIEALAQLRPMSAQLYVVNELTGQIAASPWWEGPVAFGFAVGPSTVSFRTTVLPADGGLPTMGWLGGALSGASVTEVHRCPTGQGLFNTMLGAVDDGQRIYAVAHDLQHGHRIVTIAR